MKRYKREDPVSYALGITSAECTYNKDVIRIESYCRQSRSCCVDRIAVLIGSCFIVVIGIICTKDSLTHYDADRPASDSEAALVLVLSAVDAGNSSVLVYKLLESHAGA